jgi:GNAT superfamily N-acetyltransferase
LSRVVYRHVERTDISALSEVRSADWGTIEFWTARITGYLDGTHNPQHSLTPRVIYTAVEDGSPIGLIAGHLTRRYDCDGELQWISVLPQHRGLGIASDLFYLLAGWFAEQQAMRVCVNCDTGDERAAGFFSRHGAVQLNRYWLMWYDIRLHAPVT